MCVLFHFWPKIIIIIIIKTGTLFSPLVFDPYATAIDEASAQVGVFQASLSEEIASNWNISLTKKKIKIKSDSFLHSTYITTKAQQLK